MSEGWQLWENLFERTHGPNWRETRYGHGGMCAYCSGRIETELSRKMSAQAKQYDNPTCAAPRTDTERGQ